jgi:hypothetical protein
MQQTESELKARLNAETARIGWCELQRHFARGVLVRVSPDLDLVEVACAVVRDDNASMGSWAAEGRVGRAQDAEARRWQQRDALLWAVVVAPWVLVQEPWPSASVRAED